MSNATANKPARRLGPVRLSVLILAAIAILVVSGSGFYTDVLWFNQLGYGDVFTTGIWARAAVFAAAAITFGGLTWASLYVAYRSRPIYSRVGEVSEFFAPYRELVDALRRIALVVVPLA
ncbi:MAG: hypothetical protein RL016_451, partial [Actinomycetota bacterium]